MNKANLSMLYDVSAHLQAALAVSHEISELVPDPDRPLLKESCHHLAYLNEAVSLLLGRAAELAQDLENAMEKHP